MRSDGNRVKLSFAICVSSGAVECASVEGERDISTYAVVCVTERGLLGDGGDDDDDDGVRRAVRSSRAGCG